MIPDLQYNQVAVTIP
uniref:Uncharacterized protein n=1 Tax=Anguilla anguilla TaxID=7936 RepID=A0A0E9V8W1_ANGAN